METLRVKKPVDMIKDNKQKKSKLLWILESLSNQGKMPGASYGLNDDISVCSPQMT